MLWINHSLFCLSFLCFNLPLSFSKKQIKSSLRIVGGRLAAKNEFPYIVRIDLHLSKNATDQSLESYRAICTGTALTSLWTLTAAHCIISKKNLRVFVRFNHFLPEIKGDVAKVFKSYRHPKFKLQIKFLRYDIGLLQTESVKISRYPKLSALDCTTLVGQEAFSVGHGITNITEGPRPLQVLTGMLLKCTHDRKYGIDIYIGLCLQAACGVQAATTGGDSGGPVIHSSGIVAVNSMSGVAYLIKKKRLRPVFLKPSAAVVACVSPSLDWIVDHVTKVTE